MRLRCGWTSFLVRSLCCPWEWLWVDSNGNNGKSAFRRLANWSCVSAICNHFGDIAAWSCKSLQIFAQTLPFWKKSPCGKIFKIFFRKDSLPLRSPSCLQISWNLADQKSVKSFVIYWTKKKQNFASLSRSRFCADRSQNLPTPAANNVVRVLQIWSKSFHFWRSSYSRTREHRSNAP